MARGVVTTGDGQLTEASSGTRCKQTLEGGRLQHERLKPAPGNEEAAGEGARRTPWKEDRENARELGALTLARGSRPLRQPATMARAQHRAHSWFVNALRFKGMDQTQLDPPLSASYPIGSGSGQAVPELPY